MDSLKSFPRIETAASHNNIHTTTTISSDRNVAIHSNGNMPLYKLHDAPRAPHSYGSPVPSAVPSGGANRIPPRPQLPLSSTAGAASSAAATTTTATTKTESSPSSHNPLLENAHFAHSLYFIEHLFPSKLWRILDDAERCGYADVISWVDNGMAFQIHDRERVIPILEKYFSMSKYKSFLRQLQAYGFQRALPNPKDDPCRDSKPKKEHHRGKWSHKLFRRDKMNLCNKMTRDGKTKQDKDEAVGGVGKTTTIGLVKTEPISPTSTSSSPQSPPQQPQSGILPATIVAKHHQHQKDLAAQQQQQQQLQLMHNRMLQQQQQQHHPHVPGLPHPPLYHHDPRFPHHPPPPQHPAFHHHHPQHMQQLHHHPRLPHPPASAAAPGLPPAMLARVQQQQQQKEEQHRQQLQLQIHQIKEQQLITSILNSRGGEAAPPGIPAAPAPPPILAGVNYNKPGQTPSPPVVAQKGGATEAVSEAELRRAELTLAERRWRLAEAQDRAKQEAEALAQAEAAMVKARGTPSTTTSPSQALAAQSTAAALLRQHNQAPASPPPSGTKRPAPPSPAGETASTKKRLLGNLPLTSILEDLDNAFSSSSSTEKPAAEKKTDLLKITDEELLRAKQEASKPPMQPQLVVPPPSAAAPRNASPGPSAAEREVIMARINAMEKIRLREQQQHQQQQQQMGHEQFLRKIAAAEKETGMFPKRDAATVRDAIRNAGVGLISGEATPSAARLEGIPAPAPAAMLSKEMMDIFAKTAAAAISSKSGESSSGNASQSATANNSRNASPTGTPTLKAAASLVARVAPSSLRSEALPSKVPSSGLTAAKPTVLPSASHVVTTSELEAARAMMKIPGTIEQTSKEPMRGHWELVQPEELKKGSALGKALPESVGRSAGLTYDAYKAMSQKLTPPKVMRIPKEWDTTKEPVYLVVDPANVAESALPSMATGGLSAASLAASKSGASSASLKLEQAAGTPAGLR